MQHFESLTRNIFLPILSTEQSTSGLSCDKLMDLLHRIITSLQVTGGKIEVGLISVFNYFLLHYDCLSI